MKLTTTRLIFSLLLSALISTPLLANIPKSEPLEAFVILGLPSSKAILDGNYQKAISLATRKARLDKSAFNMSAEKISLCVALLKSGKLNDASIACESAKSIASKVPTSSSSLAYYTRQNKFRKVLITASEQNLALLENLKVK